MVVKKKAVPAKKASSTRVAPSKKRAAPAKDLAKGDGLVCDMCGLVVTVDDTGWIGVHEIICCTAPMKPRKVAIKAKVAAKAKKPAPKARAAK